LASALIALCPVPVATAREGWSLRTLLECQRRVLLARDVLERGVKEFVSKSD
jgi:urease gamma subunit